MRQHDFEKIINRRGTDAKKTDPAVYPETCIPMWIADTDFECPEPITEAMVERAKQGVFGYPIERQEFADAVTRWMNTRFDWAINPEWVKYVPGVMPGMIFAIRAFTEEGDKVLIQSPVYPPFSQVVQYNNRRVEKNPLELENGRYKINFDDLEAKLSCPKTKLMFLCNPHNPVCRAYTKEELVQIGELCKKHNVIVVADEIHCDLVYKGYKHISFGSISEEFAQNCLVLINPSKTFNIAGLRTGAMIIPNKDMRDKIQAQILSNKAYGRSIFGQIGVEIAYTKCDYYVNGLMEYLQKNRDFAIEYFRGNIPEIKLIEPEATYLCWLDCRQLGLSQPELKKFMVDKAKLGFNDGATFGSEEGAGFMRMNIACPKSVLERALKQLEMAIKELSAK